MTSSIPPNPDVEHKFYRLLDDVWYNEAEANMKPLHDLYMKNKHRICKAPGSSHNHQAWSGGYVDHLSHMWDFAQSVASLGLVTVCMTDVLLVIMLHDIEKPWKYVTPYGTPDLSAFHLTDEQRNALKYTHGEGDDYRKDARVMNELAAFVHMCDVYSARILHSSKAA